MNKIYNRIICLVALFTTAWYGQGCNIVNPHEPVPTYIHVDSFHFNANPHLLGITTSSQINTVWAYYNNSLIGVFDLPANIPVITAGDARGDLKLVPGVKVNGLNGNLTSYPFYRADTFSFLPQPGKVITHIAQTSFFDNVKVSKITDFDAGATGFALAKGNIPLTSVGVPLAFEGSYSGSITLTNLGDSSVDSTIIPRTIPFGQSAFLEFDYKSTIPFYVGIQSNQGTIISTSAYYLSGIGPSAQWQKFYVFLADFITTYQGTDYTFYIKTSFADGSTTGGTLLIDNIQIVTF